MWSVSGIDDTAFTIDTSGNLRFSAPPDFETKEELNVTIVATDDGEPAEEDEFPVTVTLTEVDDPPAISGDDSLTFPENTETTTALETYSASDPDGRHHLLHLDPGWCGQRRLRHQRQR